MANYPPAQSDNAAFLSDRKAGYRVGKSRSLLEQLPEIVRAGKRQAERILEGLEAHTRVALQTRELVTPAKDTNWQEFQSLKPHAKAQATLAGDLALLNDTAGQTQLVANRAQWFNRLIYGDNLLAMAALLAGDAETPSLRGKIDLIYNDPPFDSKADYRTKITLPGAASGSSQEVEQKPTVIEQFAYSDTWADGTASYLAMIVPRLCLIHELLSEKGSMFIQLDWHVAHDVKLIIDELLGKENFRNEIIWKRTSSHSDIGQGAEHLGRQHDTIFWVGKFETGIVNMQYEPYSQEYVESAYKHIDANSGRKYRIDNTSGPGGKKKGNPFYEFRGVSKYWRYSQKTIERLFNEGRMIQTKAGGDCRDRK